MRIRKGDRVRVISGDERGKRGKILKLLSKKNACIVEGINFQKKHLRPRGTRDQQAGIIRKEGPVHVSNLLLICPKCGEPTRIGIKRLEDRKLRVCKKCEELIDE